MCVRNGERDGESVWNWSEKNSDRMSKAHKYVHTHTFTDTRAKHWWIAEEWKGHTKHMDRSKKESIRSHTYTKQANETHTRSVVEGEWKPVFGCTFTVCWISGKQHIAQRGCDTTFECMAQNDAPYNIKTTQFQRHYHDLCAHNDRVNDWTNEQMNESVCETVWW